MSRRRTYCHPCSLIWAKTKRGWLSLTPINAVTANWQNLILKCLNTCLDLIKGQKEFMACGIQTFISTSAFYLNFRARAELLVLHLWLSNYNTTQWEKTCLYGKNWTQEIYSSLKCLNRIIVGTHYSPFGSIVPFQSKNYLN